MKNRIKVIILLIILTAIYCFTTAIFTRDFKIVMLGWCTSYVIMICCAIADISNESKNNWFDKTKLW